MKLLRRFFGLSVLFYSVLLAFGFVPVRAIVNPLEVPNNKIGVHILDTGEIFSAAKLVNANGGSWGYVTIPMRSDDRNYEKWSQFFHKCRENKVIPIIRLTTYFSKDNWAAPTPLDLIDFANFLTDLPWPTKNRYVILFNEPNHSKEWGGSVSPREYADLLSASHDIFKSRSEDFFLISAGLDMSAPTNRTSTDALRFYREMTRGNPAWFNSIDGLAVHAYPNPAFSSSVRSKTRYGITSYRYELAYLKQLGFSPKPLFITETGYVGSGPFYAVALTDVWTDKNIVTITPFVLFAGAGEFSRFSLLDTSHNPRPAYNEIFALTKISGSPLLSAANPALSPPPAYSSASSSSNIKPDIISRLMDIISPRMPILQIGSVAVDVEIRTDAKGMAKGLSGRMSLPQDRGMLFVFPDSRPRNFWMKDMRFALDFVWINDNQIVGFDKNVPPPAKTGGKPAVVYFPSLADWVLEVNAGFIDTHHLQIGDTVVLNSPN